MDITDQIVRAYGSNPLDVLAQDAEHVILLINYLIQRADDKHRGASGVDKPTLKKKDDFWNF